MAPDESHASRARIIYQAAFDTYRSCIESAGGRIHDVEVDPHSGQFTWGLTRPKAGDSGRFDRCYQEFEPIDRAYARAHPRKLDNEKQLQIFRETVAPCLAANGVDFVMPTSASGDDWSRLNDEYLNLVAEGRCM